MAYRHTSKTAAGTVPAWGKVATEKLPQEAFAVVPNADEAGGWGFPHHWVSGDVLFLHRGGLGAAWAAANGARSGKRASSEVRSHLQAHRKVLGLDLSHLSLRAPVGVRAVMKRGLSLVAAGCAGPGLWPQTIKGARRLSGGGDVSESYLARMASWHERHEGLQMSAAESPGHVLWLLWGGLPGRAWARDLSARIAGARQVDLPGAFVLAGGDGARVEAGDVPAAEGALRVRKDVIREGRFVHSRTKQVVDVSPERMAHWLSAFDEMKANGVDVEFVVDHSPKADDVIGYADGLEIANGVLYATGTIRGDRGRALIDVCRNVSLRVEPFVDGNGRDYGEAITHISVCQQPVVPGQSDFVKLSRVDSGVADGDPGREELLPVFAEPEREARGADMEFMLSLQEVLGADEMDEDGALEQVRSLVTERKAGEKRLAEAEASMTALQEQVAELSTRVLPVLDEDLKAEAVEGVGDRLEQLVAGAKLTPACRDKLRPLLVEPAFMLSRKLGGGTTNLARQILAVLSENEPVALVEQTGAQVLSRQVPGDTRPVADEEDIKARGKAIAGRIH